MKKVLIPAAILAIAAAVWIYSRKPEIPTVPFAKVVRENLVSTLPTNGKVEPLEWSAVRAENPGVVDKVLVQQGQSVAVGAVLAELRLTGVQADLTAAEAQLARARAQLADIERGGHKAELAEIENGLERARFDKQEAQRDLDTLIRLEQKKAATRSDVQAAADKVAEAQIRIDAQRRKREALIGADDKTVAEALLKQGQAAENAARRRMAEAQVRAPLTGVVYNLAVRQGAYVNNGDPIAHVGRLDKLRVRVYVDEPELGRVETGQAVVITWEALPGETWSGVVDKTPTEIVPLGTRQVGEVLCTIENTGGKLVPGTNVNADIRTNSAANALTIPREAVRRDGSEPAVFLLQGDVVRWRKIAIGVGSATRVQASTGLSEGDSVALPIEAPLKDGDRVKAVYP